MLWRAQAVCRTTSPDARTRTEPFFEPNGSYKEAQAICATCPVTAECLDFAVKNGEEDGVWGGLTPWQRKHMDIFRTADCLHCGSPFRYQRRGRSQPVTCSPECKQERWLKQKRETATRRRERQRELNLVVT
jgi:WhiB family redox-sensing transcriptional regulator